MKPSESAKFIILRSLFLSQLKDCLNGYFLGKVLILTGQEIENEIFRREMASVGNRYLNLQYRNL